jgi:hypothetical protein
MKFLCNVKRKKRKQQGVSNGIDKYGSEDNPKKGGEFSVSPFESREHRHPGSEATEMIYPACNP